MSGPGLGPKTIPQPANEPSERRGEESRGENKVEKSYRSYGVVEEENQGRPRPPPPPPPPPTLLTYEAC